jgi:putative flippase GtrA
MIYQVGLVIEMGECTMAGIDLLVVIGKMLKKRPTKMKNLRKFFCFCFVGGTSALIDLIIFNIFFKLNLSFLICRIFAIVVAIVYNFSMHRHITFSAKEGKLKKQIPYYAIVYGVAIGVNLLVSMLMRSILDEGTLQANIASIVGMIAGVPVSFFGSLLFTFKNKGKEVIC